MAEPGTGARWTRRTATVASAAAMVLPWCPPATATERHPLVVGPANRLAPEDVASYVDKYGEPPLFQAVEPAAEALRRVAATAADVAIVPAPDAIAHQPADDLATVDPDALHNWPEVIDGLRRMPGSGAGGARRVVPTEWTPISVVYRADLAPAYRPRPSWEILWDPALAGRIAMPRDAALGAMIGALYAGVDPYAPTELEQAQIESVLLQQGLILARYDDDETALAADLAAGTMVAAVGSNRLMAALAATTADAAFLRPSEGLIVRTRGAVIAAGTAKLTRAVEVVDAMLDPRSGVRRLRDDGVAPANRRAFELVDETVLAAAGLSRDIGAALDHAAFDLGQAGGWRVAEIYRDLVAG